MANLDADRADQRQRALEPHAGPGRQLRRCRWAAARSARTTSWSTAFPVTDLQNRASTNPSMEAVQDMKVQVHTYDAEMGRTGGGVMNMAAKSGANTFHGVRLHDVPSGEARRAAADPEAAGPAQRARDTGATAAAAAAGRSSRTRRSSGSPARSTSTTSRRRARSWCRPTAEQRGDFSGADAQRRAVLHQGSAVTGLQPFRGNG